MRAKSNTATVYVIAVVIILVAFLLLGGRQWSIGMIHGTRSIGFANMNWLVILVSLITGFLLGFVVAKKRR